MDIQELIRLALAEDIGDGDHTSLAIIPPSRTGRANLLIKQQGIICGVDIARQVFHQVDHELDFEVYIHDGEPVVPGNVVFSVSGKVLSILQGERVALNFMQRLSGIATATYHMVQMTRDTGVKILDTRKTTPLLRELEKMAVRTGGGYNHRMGLYDMILIKDNHIDFAGGVQNAIKLVRKYLELNSLNLKVEIEVRNFKELSEVLEMGGVDRIMLDNFTTEELKQAVTMINGRFETEASGKINFDNIRDYAETGVDYISSGALTHHIRSLDMSLEAEF